MGEGGEDSKKSNIDPALNEAESYYYSNYNLQVSHFHLKLYSLKSSFMSIHLPLTTTQ